MTVKSLGHSIIVLVLGAIGFGLSGAIPALTPYLHMTIGSVLTLALNWAYIHFGIVQPAIAAGKAGRV